MDSRAKQRLTGAVILVALFVLLVPALLTGPPVADAPDSTAADDGMRRYTIDLDASAPPATTEPSPAQPPVALPPVPEERAKPGDEAAPAQSTVTDRVEPPNPAVATPAAPRPTTPTQAAPTQAAPTQAAPAQARPTPAAPAAAPAARGSFVVQLGTFGNKENADRLVREITAKGFAAFVAPFTKDGHELYRVRVGPTRDRAAAETLAAQLRRMGQSGSIVPIS
jgi:DedD protein